MKNSIEERIVAWHSDLEELNKEIEIQRASIKRIQTIIDKNDDLREIGGLRPPFLKMLLNWNLFASEVIKMTYCKFRLNPTEDK